ncbi:MAG: hypothetical protein NC093_10465 [Alistipes sp.]|nr:hypothetical protein [Alistipes sp.]
MNEILTTEEISEDDIEVMAESERVRRKSGGFADIASFQTVVCLIAAIGILILLRFSPEIAEELLNKLGDLSKEKNDIFPNPLIYLAN